MRSEIARRVVATMLYLAPASVAVGGVIDSPLPILTTGGVVAKHVFTVPGVMKNNNLETEFICTSLETANTIKFGVELFAATGGAPMNNVNAPTSNGVATLLPGETRTIGTGNTVGIHEDVPVAGLVGGSIKNGSARIVSESSRITCTAFLTDQLNNPPTSMVSLKVISKKRQNGD